jgi:hypothetical protein
MPAGWLLVSPPVERRGRRLEARDHIPGFFAFSSAAPRCKVPLFQMKDSVWSAFARNSPVRDPIAVPEAS